MAAFEVIALDTATPQLRAPGASDTYTFPRAVELPLGTANGVLYLDGSKVVTSGSALTFDGTTLGVNGGLVADANLLVQMNSPAGAGRYFASNNAGGYGLLVGYDNSTTTARIRVIPNTPLTFEVNNSEQMRLTSTGLGIGTSSPATKLHVNTVSAGYGITVAASSQTSITYQVGIDSNSNLAFYDTNAAAQRLVLSTSGNLGLGVTPSAWVDFKSIDMSSVSYSDLGNIRNAFWNGSAYIYRSTAAAAQYQLGSNGAHAWFTAPSGTAGDPISFTQALTLDANRNLLLNGTSAGASAVGTLAIFNGTAPTGSVTDGIILYAEDVSSSSELKVRDEAGNVTTLSPHNFSLIPEGPSEDMAWAYYSEKDGKRINVDMLKLARMVEKLTGEKLVYLA